jgi:dCTP deaminase
VAFWSTEKLRAQLPPLIENFDPARVKHGAYELSLGPEVVISGNHTKTLLAEHEQIAIPAGQFAHLLTEESVEIPHSAIAFISIKTSVKKTGLINVSGFHVDSGFKGRLIFSVYNAGVGSVVLSRLDPTFLIWFADLDQTTKEPYRGAHQHQHELSNADTMTLQGSVASPPALARRLEELDARVSRWFGAIRWILLTLLAAAIAATVKHYLDAPKPPATTDTIRAVGSSVPIGDSAAVPKRDSSDAARKRKK